LAASLATLVACSGSEHQVFQPLVDLSPPDAPPQDGTRAGMGEPPTTVPEGGSAAPDVTDESILAPPVDVLDPTVRFEWVETLPGQGMCAPGVYAGSFTCLKETFTFPPFVDGKVSFTLEGSAEEQRLTIAEGLVSDIGEVLYTAGLSGAVDCGAKRFAAATVDGHSLNPLDPVPAPTFEAALDGTFDDELLLIEGNWDMVNSAGETCTGTFWARPAP
jgi:hypothetical protein